MSTKLRYKDPKAEPQHGPFGTVRIAKLIRETVEEVLPIIKAQFDKHTVLGEQMYQHLARPILDHFGLEEAGCEKCGGDLGLCHHEAQHQTCEFCGKSLYQTTRHEPDPHVCESVHLKPGDYVKGKLDHHYRVIRACHELYALDEDTSESYWVHNPPEYTRHNFGDPPEGRKCR